MNETQIHYRVRKTVCEMLHDRGYKLVPFGHMTSLHDVYNQSFEAFNNNFATMLRSWQLVCERDGERLCTCCEEDYKATLDEKITETMKALEAQRMILLVPNLPKRNQMERLGDLEKRQNISIEVFSYEQLVFNITQHHLVPRHQILTTEQKEAMLKEYKIEIKQLPIILKTDAIARYLGLQPGQVVMITRESTVGGKYVNYRICK